MGDRSASRIRRLIETIEQGCNLEGAAQPRQRLRHGHTHVGFVLTLRREDGLAGLKKYRHDGVIVVRNVALKLNLRKQTRAEGPVSSARFGECAARGARRGALLRGEGD